MSNNGKVLKTWQVSWMEVTTENSVTMASGQSICMAHYQEPPSPDLQPQVWVLYLYLGGGYI